MRTWRTLQVIAYAYALRFAVGPHGTQKFHPVVKYKHYEISSGARASLVQIKKKKMICVGLDSIQSGCILLT